MVCEWTWISSLGYMYEYITVVSPLLLFETPWVLIEVPSGCIRIGGIMALLYFHWLSVCAE